MSENLTDAQQARHDLKNVYFDFNTILTLIQSGYRFDDDHAPDAIQQLEKALRVLDGHIRKLE